MREWLETAADEKAESVIRLAPHGVRTVIDVGSGTGAVLASLDRRGFADHYWACEPSAELARQMPAIGRLVETGHGQLHDCFPTRRFDLAILSHVLEHVRSPAALLAETLERASNVVVELPIEASPLTRIRTRGRDLSFGHPAGHVHFFSERGARQLISMSGGEVLAERAYFPFAPYRLHTKHLRQRLLLGLATRAEWLARAHYEHFALLVTRRSYDGWAHHYPKPT